MGVSFNEEVMARKLVGMWRSGGGVLSAPAPASASADMAVAPTRTGPGGCKNGVIVRLDCNALLMIELVRWAVVP